MYNTYNQTNTDFKHCNNACKSLIISILPPPRAGYNLQILKDLRYFLVVVFNAHATAIVSLIYFCTFFNDLLLNVNWREWDFSFF